MGAARAPASRRSRNLAGVLAGTALALGCSVPLVLGRPLLGALGIGVIVGYATAAAWTLASDQRLAGWLAVGLLLWGGSLTRGASWATIAALVCWTAFWVALFAGLAALRDPGARSRRNGRTLHRRFWPAAIEAVPPPRRGIVLAALGSAVVVLLASAAAAGASMAGISWADGWWPGPAQQAWALAVQAACAAAVPVAVGVAEGGRRWARAGVSALLIQLATPPTIEGVQDVLRQALDDPTATVFYRLLDSSSYVSAVGEPVKPNRSQQDRLVFPVTGQDGQTTALLSIHGFPELDARRVQAALTVCGPALENARLQAALRARLHEVSESRARIVHTAVAERRRLARDLHDGAQQHLLALSTRLSLARQQATRPQSVAAIDAARDHLRVALSKLRGLGRDLHPAVLETEGLMAALESLADGNPLDVELADGHVGRVSPEAETVAYLTVREILNGLALRAGATRARVTLAVHDDRLVITVTSDRVLGDKPEMPEWLAIITDRIWADGGDIRIRSGPDPDGTQGGIRVEAWIPCG
jgi:signal transduction histidine kinase